MGQQKCANRVGLGILRCLKMNYHPIDFVLRRLNMKIGFFLVMIYCLQFVLIIHAAYSLTLRAVILLPS